MTRSFSVKHIAGAAVALLFPVLVSAQGLTTTQAHTILDLLRAFNVEAAVIMSVENILIPSASTSAVVERPSTLGSPYRSSSIGYDISFNTKNYPQLPFGFAVIGVTAGKAFTHNARLATEYNWAQMSANTGPTLYLNLNAPYGSTATAAHMSTPKSCGALFGAVTTSTTSGGTYPEPTTCASYNYGYHTAEDAYAYAAKQPYAMETFWWLDVEEANSWSADTAVNDAVMQGAIDYLNSKGVHVGIYSVPYMWKNIAGTDFSPTQTINGSVEQTPTWFPIGVATQVEALNRCVTGSLLIPGSPIWIIQYEADHTAVDQNIAC